MMYMIRIIRRKDSFLPVRKRIEVLFEIRREV
jgi:hypothetical protein